MGVAFEGVGKTTFRDLKNFLGVVFFMLGVPGGAIPDLVGRGWYAVWAHFPTTPPVFDAEAIQRKEYFGTKIIPLDSLVRCYYFSVDDRSAEKKSGLILIGNW